MEQNYYDLEVYGQKWTCPHFCFLGLLKTEIVVRHVCLCVINQYVLDA